MLPCVFFFAGTRIYVVVKPEGSPFTRIAQVLVAAFRKRQLELPDNPKQTLFDPAHSGVLNFKLGYTDQFRIMENRSAIGLSWDPKVPFLSSVPKKSSSGAIGTQQVSLLKPENQLVDGLFVPPRDPKKLNKLLKKNVKDTSGPSWFEMPAPTITPELKKDLQILKMRNVIDPKRHFKKGQKSKELPKYFQMGTVIEPASEFFSSRLRKKERKATLADELLSDQSLKTYRKRKVQEIEDKRRPGGVEKWKNKGRQTWKRKKERRQ